MLFRSRLGVKTLFIEPGSPWENGYCESFNSKLRDELLNAELFSTLYEAEVLIESWRRHYNAIRPHSSLGYRPPGTIRNFVRKVMMMKERGASHGNREGYFG